MFLVNKRILKASKHLSESHKKKLIEILDVLEQILFQANVLTLRNLKISKFFELELVIIGSFMHCLKKKKL